MIDRALKQLLKGIYARTRYNMNWLPNTPLDIGDIGLFQDNVFEKRRALALEESGLVESKCTELAIDFTSGAEIGVVTKASADAPGLAVVADGSVRITFGSQGGVMVKIRGNKIKSVVDFSKLKGQLLHLKRHHQFDRADTIVTEVIVAEVTSVLLASEKDAGIVLAAKSGMPLDDLWRPEAAACVSVRNAKGMACQIVSERNLVPLYKCHGLRRRFWSNEEDVLRVTRSSDGLPEEEGDLDLFEVEPV